MTRRFGQARGFRDAIVRAGVDGEQYGELETALRDVMDFRRCRPEDRMVFERDSAGHLVLFEYRGGSATEYYRARRNGTGTLVGERVEIPVETTRIARGGVVQSSLGEAIVDLGFRRSLVGTFVSVFERKANFTTDARSGDTFRLIVEEQRINGNFHRYGEILAMQYNGQRTGTLYAFWYEPSRSDRGDYYDETGRSMHGGWLRTPLRYDRISSPFNPRRMHPILRRIVPHNGVDYAAGTGTPVWAAASGTVTFAGFKGANGNLVSIRHADNYSSHYAHLHRIERGIRNGTNVDQRQLIGYVGTTGRSTGPHLHFGLKRNGMFVDPLEVINGPGRMMSPGLLGPYRTHVRRLTNQLERIDTGAADPVSGQRSASSEEAMD
ncbi:MAG: M23 family metallopeptidase [Myxococcota bacterium]